MSERTDYLAKRLSQRRDETLELFRGLKPEDWSKKVYSEGTVWDARNVLAHFVFAEQGLVRLFQQIAAGGEGASPDFDIDRYNASRQEKLAGLSPDELIAQFEQTRAETIAYVWALSDGDLDKAGRHPTGQILPLETQIKIVYKHNQVHEQDLRAALGLPVD